MKKKENKLIRQKTFINMKESNVRRNLKILSEVNFRKNLNTKSESILEKTIQFFNELYKRRILKEWSESSIGRNP